MKINNAKKFKIWYLKNPYRDGKVSERIVNILIEKLGGIL